MSAIPTGLPASGSQWTRTAARPSGLALKLQTACIEAVTGGEFRLAYDFPQRSMIAVYQRLRIPVHDQLVTHAKVLRLNRYLVNRLRSRRVADALSTLGNPRGLDAALESAEFDDEYFDLGRRVSKDYGIHVACVPDYLNWRFRHHFHHRYEFLVARRSGVLCGFLVLLDDPAASQLNLVDCYGDRSERVWASLLESALVLARSRRRSLAAISLLSADPRVSLLKRAGFSSARKGPFILMQPGQAASRQQLCSFSYADEAD